MFFYKSIIVFIHQGHAKLIKGDSKDSYKFSVPHIKAPIKIISEFFFQMYKGMTGPYILS